MHIGDRVRLISDKQEGIIKRFINDKIAEITTSDGFDIPVLKQDLAVVNREESVFFTDEETQKETFEKETGAKLLSENGLFLAFQILDQNDLMFMLINNTDFECPFAVSENKANSRYGICSGHLKSRESVNISKLELNKIDTWPEFEVALLFARKGEHKIMPPFLKTYKFRSKRFFKSPLKIPVLNKEGYYFQIDRTDSDIDAEMLKDHLSENIENSIQKDTHRVDSVLSKEIDLHFEKLLPEAPEMSTGEILSFQLEHFEKILDRAIYLGMDEIIFIHGVGSGKLQLEIHKSLSKNKQIKYYKDAQKEKFGYGATLVRIK